MEKEIRVRFAPSPTGGLHIGGVRTALFNYLFAKQQNGKFFIRIEDTDQSRYVPGAEEYIMEALEWLGLHPDESPWVGGEFGPYRQSERKEIYLKYALQLVESGHAYYAFDTPEEIEAVKKQMEQAGAINPSYNAIMRMKMQNSITLSPEEVQKRVEKGEYVIRFKTPTNEDVRFKDLIRDWVKVHSSQLDDKVLFKSDGMPTYHLANVVDDYLMRTTHVIRGEEWLPSAPLHVLLYQAFGWENEMPLFAHLPLILKPDLKDEKGKIIEKRHGKLSKRDAQDMGFPIFPLAWQGAEGYKEAGYLPEALLNFLALLGWNAGTDQEIFSLDELIAQFSIERIHLGGAKFDIDKAKWFNQQYLKTKSNEELLPFLEEGLKNNQTDVHIFTKEKYLKICEITKDRIHFPQEMFREASYIFVRPEHYDENTVNKKWNEQSAQFVSDLSQALNAMQTEWNAENIHQCLQELVNAQNIKLGQVMPAVRVVLTGVGSGLDLMQVMEIIGKEETLGRFEQGLKKLGVS